MCTCPPKLTFNPYSGCDHACVYCYASSYIPDFRNCRPKKDLIKILQREASKLGGQIVSIANSSDPYPNSEAENGLMRECLRVLSEQDCQIQIITKSAIVARDSDLLSKVRSTVALTITTDDDETARKIEPSAPSPTERLGTVETLLRKAIPVSVRIDPIIPFVNDNAAKLLSTLASMGVKHVTSSTYKAKYDNWQRLAAAMPKTVEKLRPLYFEKGEKKGGYTLLPKHLRFALMKNIRSAAEKNGLKFGVCREGMSHLNTATCDGSWLLLAKEQR